MDHVTKQYKHFKNKCEDTCVSKNMTGNIGGFVYSAKDVALTEVRRETIAEQHEVAKGVETLNLITELDIAG